MSAAGGGAAAEVQVMEGARARERTEACAEAARRGGLAVFLDFDRTMTRCFLPGGGRCTSAHGVMESAGMLSEEFRSKTKQLFEKYYPVEIDATMSIEEKIPIMNEWYSQVHSLMLRENVMRRDLHSAVAECTAIELRDGIADLILRCQKASPPIPVIVMSAGLGDVIEDFLQLRLPFELAPTTMVVSNRMSFDGDGRLSGFSEPLLHMFNKTAKFMPDAGRELVKGRGHCLLLGDSVGDLTMADSLEVETLKVGFLNEKVDERLAQYCDLFDVVVTNDGKVPEVCFQAIGV
mmetsp:Transcript_50406/g.155913  ORF Transcript_50406/g.155913 Transcript_50406/m.155913 type:complete len:292 (+) Transcript_50406:136-1011(+)